MGKSSFFTVIFAILMLLNPAEAAESKPPVVVEIFTAESCVASDSLDATLESLHKEFTGTANLTVLTCYKDHRNPDRAGAFIKNEACTQRHRYYFKKMNLTSMGSPRAIINGRFEMDAQSLKTLKAGVRMVAAMNTVKSLPVTRAGNNVQISRPADGVSDARVDVWLATYEDNKMIRIEKIEDIDWKDVPVSIDLSLYDAGNKAGWIMLHDKNTAEILATAQFNKEL